MVVKLRRQEGAAIVKLEGRLDTNTAPEVQDGLLELADEKIDITLDFQLLAYVSSAGLRVLLMLQKKMLKLGTRLLIINIKPEIKEVFEMTGFSGILNLE